MNEITPDKHLDGTETVTLYGTVVDVTGKDEFDLFKKHYKIARIEKSNKPAKKSPKVQSETE